MRVVFEESVEYHDTKTVRKQKITLDVANKAIVER